MKTLNYKGYIGSIEVSEEDNCLFGTVIGLPKDTAITFEGETVSELREDFEGAIDDYLISCEERGIEPKRTYKGAFNVRVTPELHAQLDMCARRAGVTLNRFVADTLSHSVAL